MPPRNYLNRSLCDGIRTIGFRKWYERELLSSHAHMLLALLSTIALMAIMELFHGATVSQKFLNTGLFILALHRFRCEFSFTPAECSFTN